MTSPIRLLRHLLFMPWGNPAQQEKDVAAIEQELQSGKERVHAARLSVEKSQELRVTFAKLLERT
jgi:hypothetical protein